MPPMNETQLCPYCGHPFAPDEVAAALPGRQRRLFEIIRAAGSVGISARDILGMMYAADPNGGPNTTNIISVFAHHANKKLKPFGLAISARRGQSPLWRLLKIEEGAP